MSCTDDHRAVALPLDELCGPIARELERVEEILRRELRSEHPYVDELIRHGCLLGGKRLRPILLLLSAKSVGYVTDDHLTLAAVIEMIHTATLIHDDVLDEASVRRHVATVNARWDNQASVLLGDFLFSHAFALASVTGSAVACRIIGRATNTVCEGELRQKGSRADYSLSEFEYYEIVDAKTAALCACSCQLGACFAGASGSLIESLTRYGHWLGRAFQIADDLLDLVGDEEATGKSLGTDLAQRKPTLPVIRALQLADVRQHRALLSLLRGDDPVPMVSLRHMLQQLGALDYARAKGLEFAATAVKQLDTLPSSASAQALRRLAQSVVDRSH